MSTPMMQSLLRQLEEILERETREIVDESEDVMRATFALLAYLEETGTGQTPGGFATTVLLGEIVNQARSIRAMAIRLHEKAEAVQPTLVPAR